MGIQLEEFLEKRKNKLSITSPAITEIHTNTVRVKKNQVANDKEFITKRGKPFPKGSLYHIHYTKIGITEMEQFGGQRCVEHP